MKKEIGICSIEMEHNFSERVTELWSAFLEKRPCQREHLSER